MGGEDVRLAAAIQRKIVLPNNHKIATPVSRAPGPLFERALAGARRVLWCWCAQHRRTLSYLLLRGNRETIRQLMEPHHPHKEFQCSLGALPHTEWCPLIDKNVPASSLNNKSALALSPRFIATCSSTCFRSLNVPPRPRCNHRRHLCAQFVARRPRGEQPEAGLGDRRDARAGGGGFQQRENCAVEDLR